MNWTPPIVDLSMRDWFAGQALALMVQPDTPASIAAFAYQIADAMIAERKKDTKP
jgi:hypothetical protein